MTTLNVSLPRNLKQFAEKQAAKKGLGGASDYVRSLLSREVHKRTARADLQAELHAGVDSGPSFEITPQYWAKKRAKLLGRSTSKNRKST
jgi:Arc/MetJ-type ribon-helix-helix transcriptional regulator